MSPAAALLRGRLRAGGTPHCGGRACLSQAPCMCTRLPQGPATPSMARRGHPGGRGAGTFPARTPPPWPEPHLQVVWDCLEFRAGGEQGAGWCPLAQETCCLALGLGQVCPLAAARGRAPCGLGRSRAWGPGGGQELRPCPVCPRPTPCTHEAALTHFQWAGLPERVQHGERGWGRHGNRIPPCSWPGEKLNLPPSLC